jgi:DNA uptake protein ComE-like DNA-binding protein
MSNLVSQKSSIPAWVWLAIIPSFGGLALVYRAKSLKNKLWLYLGIGITVSAFIFHSSSIALGIWLAQSIFAIWFNHHLNRGNKISPFPIDINTCSKHDLVYHLNLPIVYANDIEAVKNAGYLFTHLEELSEIAGLPENYLKQLANLVVFSYNINLEVPTSWRRVNSYSQEELIQAGLETRVAAKIIQEREANGIYRSALEISKRTDLPLTTFQHLI